MPPTYFWTPFISRNGFGRILKGVLGPRARLLQIQRLVMGLRFLVFGALWGLVSISAQGLFAQPLTYFQRQALRQGISLAAEIQRAFPPSEYHYVFVGQSPSALMAVFEAQGLTAVSNLPFSQGDMISGSVRRQTEKIDEHWSRFFPDSGTLGTRKIVMIDFVQSGVGLKMATRISREFLKRKERSDSIEMLALWAGSGMARDTAAGALGPDARMIRVGGFYAASMSDEAFDDLSPYGPFDLRTNASPPKQLSPAYRQLVEAFRHEMRKSLPKRHWCRSLVESARLMIQSLVPRPAP